VFCIIKTFYLEPITVVRATSHMLVKLISFSLGNNNYTNQIYCKSE